MVSFEGGSASKVDDVTALLSRHKMADICYYGNVMTTTRWWLCVTILHLRQYSHRVNLLFFSQIPRVLGFFPSCKAVEWCEVNHTSLPSAQVTNEWSYTSTPPLVFMPMDKENFTFFYCN